MRRIAMRVDRFAIARENVSTGTIDYYGEDMLGTSRTIVQAGQTSVCYDADFYPLGGERVATNSCPQNYKFEGKERDAETNNDDFGARYYSSSVGRWLSADWSSVPAPVPYANLTNPQTLNLYAMVSDNPESFADLDGHDSVHTTGPTTATDDPMCGNVDSPKGACDAEGAGEFLRAVTTDANNGQSDPVTIDVAYTTYEVQGATAEEAWNNASKANASGCGSDQGCTSFTYGYGDQPAGSVSGGSPPYTATLTTTDVTVTMNIKVSTPSWTGYKDAAAAEQNSWDALVGHLKAHEQGHVLIDEGGAQALLAAVKGATAKGSGKTQRQALDNAAANLSIEYPLKDANLPPGVYEVQVTYGQFYNPSPTRPDLFRGTVESNTALLQIRTCSPESP